MFFLPENIIRVLAYSRLVATQSSAMLASRPPRSTSPMVSQLRSNSITVSSGILAFEYAGKCKSSAEIIKEQNGELEGAWLRSVFCFCFSGCSRLVAVHKRHRRLMAWI